MLLERHPSREWARLADLLENPNARSQVILFLRAIAGRKQSDKPKQLRATSAKPKVSSRGREKESVERLDLELSRRSISELRELANQQGLSFSVKDSKQRLINRILKASPKAPLKIERNSKIRRHDEGDYAQWAEIIMGANKKKP